METPNAQIARTQADGLDNIAPTAVQGAAAWQYAATDGFLSNEEASAVLRRQIEPDRSLLQNKLDSVGITRDFLKDNPAVENALFSGQPTPGVTLQLANDLQLQGRLRIALTPAGPELRVTPVHPALTIPDKVAGYDLNQQEKDELQRQGYVQKPLQVAQGSDLFVPGYLRVDPQTNTVDLWRVRPDMLPTKLLGVDLTRDQQSLLANGHPVKLSGLLDNQGQSYNGTVSLSPAKGTLQLSEVTREQVAIKPMDERDRQQVAHNNEGAKTDLTRSQETVQRLLERQNTDADQPTKKLRVS